MVVCHFLNKTMNKEINLMDLLIAVNKEYTKKNFPNKTMKSEKKRLGRKIEMIVIITYK